MESRRETCHSRENRADIISEGAQSSQKCYQTNLSGTYNALRSKSHDRVLGSNNQKQGHHQQFDERVNRDRSAGRATQPRGAESRMAGGEAYQQHRRGRERNMYQQQDGRDNNREAYRSRLDQQFAQPGDESYAEAINTKPRSIRSISREGDPNDFNGKLCSNDRANQMPVANHFENHITLGNLRKDIVEKNKLIEQKNKEIVKLRMENEEYKSNF